MPLRKLLPNLRGREVIDLTQDDADDRATVANRISQPGDISGMNLVRPERNETAESWAMPTQQRSGNPRPSIADAVRAATAGESATNMVPEIVPTRALHYAGQVTYWTLAETVRKAEPDYCEAAVRECAMGMWFRHCNLVRQAQLQLSGATFCSDSTSFLPGCSGPTRLFPGDVPVYSAQVPQHNPQPPPLAPSQPNQRKRSAPMAPPEGQPVCKARNLCPTRRSNAGIQTQSATAQPTGAQPIAPQSRVPQSAASQPTTPQPAIQPQTLSRSDSFIDRVQEKPTQPSEPSSSSNKTPERTDEDWYWMLAPGIFGDETAINQEAEAQAPADVPMVAGPLTAEENATANIEAMKVRVRQRGTSFGENVVFDAPAPWRGLEVVREQWSERYMESLPKGEWVPAEQKMKSAVGYRGRAQ